MLGFNTAYLRRVKRADHKLLHLFRILVVVLVVVLVVFILVAGRHLALRLVRLSIDTVGNTVRHIIVARVVDIHTFLGEQLLDLLLGGRLASLLALGRVAWAAVEHLVVLIVLIVILLSQDALHLVGVEVVLIVVILAVIVVKVKRLADDLERSALRCALLALWLCSRVDSCHSDAEGRRDVRTRRNRHIAGGDFESYSECQYMLRSLL